MTRARPPTELPPVEHLRSRLGRRHENLARIHRGITVGTPSPSSLHDWHRELRRLRVDARPWIALVPRAQGARWDNTDRALKGISGAIGAVRNFDVSLQLLEHLPRGAARDASVPLGRLRRGLLRLAREGRRHLRAEAGRIPLPVLLDDVGRPLRTSLPRTAALRLAREIEERLTVQVARVERSLARAYRRPTVSRLHVLRIELRRLRALDQMGVAVLHRAPLPFSMALRSLQYDLGQLHDWDLLRETANELLEGKGRKRVDRILGERVRAARRRVRRLLSKRPIRRDLEGLIRASPA